MPGPVKAVVLLFPIDDEGEARRKEEDERIAREGQPKIDPSIFWVKQKVSTQSYCMGFSEGTPFPHCLDFERLWDNWPYPFTSQCERFLVIPSKLSDDAFIIVRCNFFADQCPPKIRL